MESPVDVSIRDGIAVVTLNEPKVNAQTLELMESLTAIFDQFNDNRDVRVVVLTGAGKVFSAGADLKNRIKTGAEPGRRWAHLRRTRETFYAVMECEKPVIAAVNGPALGAGMVLASSCDIMIASDNANFGLPEIDVGLMGGARHAMEIFSRSLTRRMVFTGYRVPASELYRLGIIEACTTPEELMPTALSMAAMAFLITIVLGYPYLSYLRRLGLGNERRWGGWKACAGSATPKGVNSSLPTVTGCAPPTDGLTSWFAGVHSRKNRNWPRQRAR